MKNLSFLHYDGRKIFMNLMWRSKWQGNRTIGKVNGLKKKTSRQPVSGLSSRCHGVQNVGENRGTLRVWTRWANLDFYVETGNKYTEAFLDVDYVYICIYIYVRSSSLKRERQCANKIPWGKRARRCHGIQFCLDKPYTHTESPSSESSPLATIYSFYLSLCNSHYHLLSLSWFTQLRDSRSTRHKILFKPIAALRTSPIFLGDNIGRKTVWLYISLVYFILVKCTVFENEAGILPIAYKLK